MAALADLPDHVLEVILQLVTGPLLSDSSVDTFHRIREWLQYSRVCQRWKDILTELPVSVLLLYSLASEGQHTSELSATECHLRQIARRGVPVCSLTIAAQQLSAAAATVGRCHPPDSLRAALAALVASERFQRSSGGALQSLVLRPAGDCGFDFDVPPAAFSALKTLRGVGGRLPRGLPPNLETLEYTAGPADGSKSPFGSEELLAVARHIGQLPNLRQLLVRRCWDSHLPPEFVSRLPPSVRRADFDSCLLTVGDTWKSPLPVFEAAAPPHLRFVEWQDEEDVCDACAVLATFRLEAKTADYTAWHKL